MGTHIASVVVAATSFAPSLSRDPSRLDIAIPGAPRCRPECWLELEVPTPIAGAQLEGAGWRFEASRAIDSTLAVSGWPDPGGGGGNAGGRPTVHCQPGGFRACPPV